MIGPFVCALIDTELSTDAAVVSLWLRKRIRPVIAIIVVNLIIPFDVFTIKFVEEATPDRLFQQSDGTTIVFPANLRNQPRGSPRKLNGSPRALSRI